MRSTKKLVFSNLELYTFSGYVQLVVTSPIFVRSKNINALDTRTRARKFDSDTGLAYRFGRRPGKLRTRSRPRNLSEI